MSVSINYISPSALATHHIRTVWSLVSINVPTVDHLLQLRSSLLIV